MKRFIIDPFEVTKNSTYMSFPLILDVVPYCDASCLEVLFNVSAVEWYPKNIFAVKKGEDKTVHVTERPKNVISPWSQEEKIYQLGWTPAYQVNSFKYLYISCKLSKDTISLANT